MFKWLALIALMFIVAGCGSTTPCDDSDPVGICATSHGKIYGGS